MVQHLRMAVRQWSRDPWFFALAALALGLGIGVNNTFFALTNAAVIRGLPIEDASRVMLLGSLNAQGQVRGLSYEHFQEIQRHTTTLSGVAAFNTMPATLTDETFPPEAVTATGLSSGGFSVIGRQPVLGRNFLPEDDRPGAPLVAILGDRLFETRFNRDRGIIGRTIIVNGRPAVVVGVMEPGFRFPGATDLWIPLSSQAGRPAEPSAALAVAVYGRLAQGDTRASAQEELSTFARQWQDAAPAGTPALRTTVVPINAQMVGRVTDLVWLTFLTVGGLVLLVACANVANLLLMRGAERGHELAIRVGLGATRGQVVRQLLAEGSVLALAGGAAGLLLSLQGLRVLALLVPPDVPFLADLQIDARVMTVLMATVLGSVLLFGLAPAIHLSNVAPAEMLAEGGRAVTRPRRQAWIASFLAVEFALTLVLACSVVLGMRFNRAARTAEFQVETSPVLTAWVTLPPQPYGSPEARNAFFDRLEASVASGSSVLAASIASAIPGGGGPLRELAIDGRRQDSPPPQVVTSVVGPDYFRALGVPLLRGRALQRADAEAGTEGAIVNQRFVDLFFPNEDPLKQRIRVGTAEAADGAMPSWVRIVGVSPNVRQRQQSPVEPDPVVYLSRQAHPPATAVLLVRTTGNPGALTGALRAQLRQIDPSLPLTRALTLDDALQQARWMGQVSSALLYGVGGSALLLALVGLYAVTAHAVRQRQREIGVRMAMGAQPADVVRLVLVPTGRLLALGLAVGIGCTAAFDGLFTTTDIRLTDLWVLGPALMGMTVVALAACVVPVLRAQRLDPVVVLRQQ